MRLAFILLYSSSLVSLLVFTMLPSCCANLIRIPLVSLVLSQISFAQFQCPNQTKSKYPLLIDATTEELATGLEAGSITSVDLVTAYIDRILEVNSTLNVVQELNPDALRIAFELDLERQFGIVRGPLHGIPILIKGNIATNDNMTTTAGSFALYGATVPKDSGVVAKLRRAGALILGKTNLSQWANFRSVGSTNGWSAFGGQCEGAYFPQQDPSGSSSGSGVASSLGLALASLGTETSGSILSPAEVNNLVAIKPTVGLTSRALVIPISEHQDTIGPMARTVRDAAYLLQAIAGKDPDDNYTSAIPFDPIPDYVAALNFSSLRGTRFGIPRNVIQGADPPVAAAFEAAVKLIRRAGASVTDNANITEFALSRYLNSRSSTIVLDADFITDLPQNYLSKLTTNPNNIRDLVDVDNFTHSFPAEDWPDRDTAVWDSALGLGFNNTDPRFWAAYQENLLVGGKEGILGVLQNHSFDALLLPTAFSPGLPALVGTPVVTVPLGFYPPDTKITKNVRKTLVQVGPNIP